MTTVPPEGAGPLRVAVHVTLPAPVMVAELQDKPLSFEPADGFNWTAKDIDARPEVAVRVTVLGEPNEDTGAVNVTLLPPAGILSEAGTTILELLLESVTRLPPAGVG